jgi:hypothetical protein
MARDDTALSILFSLLASPSIDMRNHAATPTAWDDAVPFLAQVTSDEHKWVTSAKRRRAATHGCKRPARQSPRRGVGYVAVAKALTKERGKQMMADQHYDLIVLGRRTGRASFPPRGLELDHQCSFTIFDQRRPVPSLHRKPGGEIIVNTKKTITYLVSMIGARQKFVLLVAGSSTVTWQSY